MSMVFSIQYSLGLDGCSNLILHRKRKSFRKIAVGRDEAMPILDPKEPLPPRVCRFANLRCLLSVETYHVMEMAPLIDEIRIKLHGAKYFTKLDLTNAFYHLELSKESRDLTTFLSENGMFRYTRLMFGVNAAPEIFQREMCRVLEGIENIIIYIDDILAYADTLEKLRKITSLVLIALRKNNLTLNMEKCLFYQTRIKFLGHELDCNGFHVEEAKIKAIPTDTKNWMWGPEQQVAFETTIKNITDCATTLGYFSEDDRTVLYTDASPNALGAVLVQENQDRSPRIISFASKSLSATEKNYPQNQREALGTVWAVEHFSFFLLGRHFTLRTDAQGLSFILNRNRENTKRALTRADGWALRLSPYSYDVEYVRGSNNIADPSSRLYVGTDEPFDNQHSPWEIAALEINTAGFLTESEIRLESSKDTIIQKVMDALETRNWTKDLAKFQCVADHLSNENGILVKSGCVVVPDKLRQKTLEVAHEGHPMTAKMKSIVRERVWWPGISKDVAEWVDSCQACALNGRPEKPTPMQRIIAPQAVWDTIALDFNGPYARIGGISILVIVEYRSRYLIARPVKSTSFEHTKSVLESIFAREGFPKNIRSDNGPPFNGEPYKLYCTSRGIQTIYTTPLFPQQNGLVENYMKLINKAMSTAFHLGSNFNDELQAAINAHNAATHSVTGFPPEEVMLGRKVHRNFPLLNFERVNCDDNLLNDNDLLAKMKGKHREDARRGARKCRINPGDMVIIERQTRSKGDTRFGSQRFTVIKEDNGSLTLHNSLGQSLKRHITQVKKIGEWRADNTRSNAENSRESNVPDEIHQRPKRSSNPPSFLDDYVQTDPVFVAKRFNPVILVQKTDPAVQVKSFDPAVLVRRVNSTKLQFAQVKRASEQTSASVSPLKSLRTDSNCKSGGHREKRTKVSFPRDQPPQPPKYNNIVVNIRS
ncbi:uncharacterized protein K02A2.6-like [Uranotaenia lowii]|uniref:uncharacterized protein K02A2.6-like n=1 Tax=Uranotaenia lowii TaxID=190385 RepID=UPI002478B7D3|nr:uncharacterized protein K02A2.6-like [Uranotaenia lowii]